MPAVRYQQGLYNYAPYNISVHNEINFVFGFLSDKFKKQQ